LRKFLLTWKPGESKTMTEVVQCDNWDTAVGRFAAPWPSGQVDRSPPPQPYHTERLLLSACPAGNAPAPGSRIGKRQVNVRGMANRPLQEKLPWLILHHGQAAGVARANGPKGFSMVRRAIATLKNRTTDRPGTWTSDSNPVMGLLSPPPSLPGTRASSMGAPSTQYM
jgi:hypothetical protein